MKPHWQGDVSLSAKPQLVPCDGSMTNATASSLVPARNQINVQCPNAAGQVSA